MRSRLVRKERMSGRQNPHRRSRVCWQRFPAHGRNWERVGWISIHALTPGWWHADKFSASSGARQDLLGQKFHLLKLFKKVFLNIWSDLILRKSDEPGPAWNTAGIHIWPIKNLVAVPANAAISHHYCSFKELINWKKIVQDSCSRVALLKINLNKSVNVYAWF